jgi:hypothetical protein
MEVVDIVKRFYIRKVITLLRLPCTIQIVPGEGKTKHGNLTVTTEHSQL